jgi:hypothetical protein
MESKASSERTAEAAPTRGPGERSKSAEALLELDLLIRARYPILYVVTWEELRVQRHL